MEKWANKVAVVTGASSGIGAAIAKALAEKEVIVVGIGRRDDKIQNLADGTDVEICSRYCDLSNEEEIVDTFAWVASKYGSIDILVNCAGVCYSSSLIDGDVKDWKTMMNINVMALSISTKQAVRMMRYNNFGQVIHINSVVGHLVPHFKKIPVGMYSATKHAVTALTEAMRLELLDGESKIKISSISPGSVYTPLHLKMNSSDVVGDDFDDSVVPDGFLKVDDVVDAVLYILSTSPRAQVQDLILQAIGQEYH